MARQALNQMAVITEAADLADRDGFASISVSAVARHLGVQPASLYSHVRDRAALLDGVHELALADLAELVSAGIAGRSGRAAVAGLAEAHRGFAGDHPGRWAALQRPAIPATAGSPGATRLATLIWAVLRAYDLPEPELVHAARFVGALINGFVNLERTGGFEHRSPDVDLSWERAVDAVDVALLGWPAAEEAPHG